MTAWNLLRFGAESSSQMIEAPMRSSSREVRWGKEESRQRESATRTEPVTVRERAFVGVGGGGGGDSSTSGEGDVSFEEVEEPVLRRKGARKLETKFEVVFPQMLNVVRLGKAR